MSSEVNVKVGEKSLKAKVLRLGEKLLVKVDGDKLSVTLLQEKKAEFKTPEQDVTTSKPSIESLYGEVKSPIPGRILEVKVKPGDLVRRGQALVILESMKMQNEISSPRDGVVKEVKVKPGDVVNTGDVLITFKE